MAFLGGFSSPGLLSWDICNSGLSSVGVGEVGRCCEGTQEVYSGGFGSGPDCVVGGTLYGDEKTASQLTYQLNILVYLPSCVKISQGEMCLLGNKSNVKGENVEADHMVPKSYLMR